MNGTETCRRWNAQAGEWQTVTVGIVPAPRRLRRTATARTRRQGTPRDLAGISDRSPVPEWWRDTAFAPCTGFADMRTYIKPDTIQTHRAPVVAFTDVP